MPKIESLLIIASLYAMSKRKNRDKKALMYQAIRAFFGKLCLILTFN